jgi:hypothetical protein
MSILNFDRLEVIAMFAIGDPDFRKKAIDDPKGLETLLDYQDLKDKISSYNLGDISEAEKTYCIAWATLAKIQFGDDDTQILLAIAKTLSDHEEPSG